MTNNTMEQLLSQLGISVGANAIWDFLKMLFGKAEPISKESLKKALANFLKVQEAEIKADKIIEFLAENKHITVGKENKISILLENINAEGNVIGFEGNTSNSQVKEIFENKPMDITLKQVNSGGNVIGMKLNVDDGAELKQPLNVKGDFGSAQFNPGDGRRIIFGGSAEDSK